MFIESAFQAVAILAFLTLVATVHGLVLTFRSSIILGIVFLFFLAVPFAFIAIIYWATGIDIPARVVKALPEIFVA